VPLRPLSPSILLYGQIPIALPVWHTQKQPKNSCSIRMVDYEWTGIS
jgi:hypothetical protein